jgi:hypothetical protein
VNALVTGDLVLCQLLKWELGAMSTLAWTCEKLRITCPRERGRGTHNLKNDKALAPIFHQLAGFFLQLLDNPEVVLKVATLVIVGYTQCCQIEFR